MDCFYIFNFLYWSGKNQNQEFIALKYFNNFMLIILYARLYFIYIIDFARNFFDFMAENVRRLYDSKKEASFEFRANFSIFIKKQRENPLN